MNRRSLTAIAAAGALLVLPAAATAASGDALLAQSPSGTLSADAFAAGSATGTLTDKASPSGSAKPSTGAVADELPFTGSDPRLTLLFGLAAVLAGAGLRLRTGDARDY